ncbi:unnamed protein product [Ceutorhynchus assimilis]|uniref:Uncharacterized protein n=1 Tax=Ceutorhynchus assimilis TaxID=467358 RepID=A0A9N9MC18_9CUCU|nr:unnamed protein product [Ceutorhynchus assimilis]
MKKKRKLIDTSITGDNEIYKKKESTDYFTLKETIDMITKIGVDLQKYMEQNIKKEVKELTGSRKIDKMTIETDAQTSPEKPDIAASQSEQPTVSEDPTTGKQPLCPRCGSYYAWNKTREDTCTSLEGINSYEDWKKVSEKKWDEKLYANTELQLGNLLNSKDSTVKVVLVEPSDAKMENSIQQMFKNRFPELTETDRDFAVLEQSSKWKLSDEISTRQKIVKIMQGDQERDLWDRLIELREETKNDEWIAMHHIERCSNDRLRKIVETIFHGGKPKVAIYTNRKQTSQKRDRQSPPALIIAQKGKKYEDIVKTIKESLKDGGPPPTPEKVDPAIEKVVILLRPVVQGFDHGLDLDSIGKYAYGTTEGETEGETKDETIPVSNDNFSNVV